MPNAAAKECSSSRESAIRCAQRRPRQRVTASSTYTAIARSVPPAREVAAYPVVDQAFFMAQRIPHGHRSAPSLQEGHVGEFALAAVDHVARGVMACVVEM